jgi:hypothetical protein
MTKRNIRSMGIGAVPRLILRLIPLLIIFHFACTDLSEYEPEGPPQKADPPEGPSVLLPTQDTIFFCVHYCWVPLDWTQVNGAWAYEFQVSMDSSFMGSFPYQGQYPPTEVSTILFGPGTTYYFRVRAYSDLWIWYTDWSDVRRFYLMPVE